MEVMLRNSFTEDVADSNPDLGSGESDSHGLADGGVDEDTGGGVESTGERCSGVVW